jgi:hypothetical protein
MATGEPTPPVHRPERRKGKRRGILWRAMVLSRAKRRWRWAFRAAVAVPLVLIAAFIVVTHSPLTRWLIVPGVAKATGLEVDVDSVYIRRDGTIVLERAAFTIPGVSGEAGEFLRIARVEAGVKWWRTLRGNPTITSVSLIDPVLIVSESTADGSLNVGRVPVPGGASGTVGGGGSGGGGGGGATSPLSLPMITATNMWIELGEHGPGVGGAAEGYTRLKRIQMDGSVIPAGPGEFTVSLHEAAHRRAAGDGRGFRVGGTVSQGRIDLNLINFSLSDWPPPTLPASIRDVAQDLALVGEVSSAKFSYTETEGIRASMQLQGVAMNLPLEASVQGPEFVPEGQTPPIRYMRMKGVEGSIVFARESVTARVSGLIEDLPYRVNLRYDGVEVDSPFRAEITSKDFLVSRNPELLLFAPPSVRYYLKTFLMPTGLLTTNVTVVRGPPATDARGTRQPGPITVSGSIDFREGTAAYETFPYEFNDMAGRFEFDNDQISIINITGRSRTGAKLHARGRIAPLDESSEVDIHVNVSEAQIDEAMEAAFGPDRGAVIRSLFNEQRHQELIDAGLIRTPEQAAAERAELESLLAQGESGDRVGYLQQRRAVPTFDFRGRASVFVHVYAPRGVGAEYQTSVDVSLPRVGIVPEKFPFPLIAEDVAVEVRNQQGRLVQGTFRGVNGGRADVAARFLVPGKSDTGAAPPPEIVIHADQIPFDDLLTHALPGGQDSRLKQIIGNLNISASGSAEVRIGPRPAAEGSEIPLGFDISAEITSGEARPGPEDSHGIAVGGLVGTFEASERYLFLDVEGVPVRTSPDAWREGRAVGPPRPLLTGASGMSSRVGGTLTVHIRGEFPEDDTPSSFFVSATCPTFDATSTFEPLIGVFSSEAAAKTESLKKEHSPSGFADVRVEANLVGAEPPDVRVSVSGGRDLAADILGHRLIVPEMRGVATLLASPETTLTFDSAAGNVSLAGASGPPVGLFLVDGRLPLGPGDGRVDVALLDGRFESALVRPMLERFGGAAAASLYDRLRPIGTFDANVAVVPGSEQPRIANGRIEPHALTIEPLPGGKRSPVACSGAAEFEPDGGTLRGLSLESSEWKLQVDGAWTVENEGPAAGSIGFRSIVSARGNKLTDELRAVLPEELRGLLEGLKLTITGPFAITDATLDVDRVPSAGEPAVRFVGQLDFVGAGLEAGVPISDMDGVVSIRFDDPGPRPSTFELDLLASRFEVSGVTLFDGVARVQSGAGPGQIQIPYAHGSCHGGRFSVRADIAPESESTRVNADFQLSGVRFNSLLRELVQSIKPLVGPPAPPDPLDQNAAVRRRNEFSRGLLDAELTLTALASDPASRRGRGTMRISGGRVVNLPLVTGLIEALNLQLPFNSSLDFAWASIFLEGPAITFEELSVQSASIEMSGGGTMTWPGRELDLRLQSRAARPIPILSALWQGIRHQLVVTTITGKLGEPEIGIQAPGPTRMIDGIIGDRTPDEAGGRDKPRTGVSPERARERSGRRGIRPSP